MSNEQMTLRTSSEFSPQARHPISQRFCRSHANTLFNVAHDKNFLRLTPANEGDVHNFEVNRVWPQPYTTIRTQLGQAQAEGRMEHCAFRPADETDSAGDDADTEILRELFCERLERVQRLVKASQLEAGESPNGAQRQFRTDLLRPEAPYAASNCEGIHYKNRELSLTF